MLVIKNGELERDFVDEIYPERIKECKEIAQEIAAIELNLKEEDQELFFDFFEQANRENRQFNLFCKEFNQEPIPDYTLTEDPIIKKYNDWKTSLNMEDVDIIERSSRKLSILKILKREMALAPEIAKEMKVNVKDLYYTLNALVEDGFIYIEDVQVENHGNMKIYKITPKGLRYFYTVGEDE